MAARTELSRAAVADQLRALGVKTGGVLLVHTSFRAVRPVEGGPLGLIAALRDASGPDGTLVMPSMSDDDDAPFDPKTSRSAPDLGIVADTFWRMPGVARSDHPFAFAATGPQAGAITADPLPLPPHGPASPVGRVHELDGQVLLLGCSHGENTTLHLAEILGGARYRVPRHCTVLKDGRPTRSTMARTIIAASASRWRTSGCGPTDCSMKAASAMRMHGSTTPKISSASPSKI